MLNSGDILYLSMICEAAADHIIMTWAGDNIVMTRIVWMNEEFCSAGIGPSCDNQEANQVTIGGELLSGIYGFIKFMYIKVIEFNLN